MRTAAAFFLLASLLGACAPVDSVDPDEVTVDEVRVCRATTSATTRAALESASAGLTYMSESDYPFDYVAYPSVPAGQTVTRSQFMAAARIAPGTPVEVRTLDQTFAHLTNPDVTGDLALRYAALLRTIRANLTYAKVYRVGTIQVHLYIVGRDHCGRLAGLHTISIET